MEPMPELSELRALDAVVIGVEERPLLSLAECSRARAALPGLQVALLGPRDERLEAAAERAGALFLTYPAPDSGQWEALTSRLRSCRAAATAAGRTWISPRMCVDRDARLLYIDGRACSLSSAKFDLLTYLLDHAGRAVPSQELVQRGLLRPSQASRYKGLIAELRRHLGAERDCIRAVPGYGYRLDVEPRPLCPDMFGH